MDNELMLGLRKLEGIDVKEFLIKYGQKIEDVYPIKELIEKKDLIYKDNHLYINPNKIYVMNEILLKLL